MHEGSDGSQTDTEEEKKEEEENIVQNSIYNYPYSKEISNTVAEFTITTNSAITTNLSDIKIDIPYLKYNKSWLLMLTQDDCKHAAFCRTWAAINGKPVSTSVPYPTPTATDPDRTTQFYYDVSQLLNNDLPPNVMSNSRTLGSTDGTGNEVRFSFTTTLAPEESWMNREANVNPGFQEHYSRFYMQSGLDWRSVKELLNYDIGIAFHDVMAEDVYNTNMLINHYSIAQNEIIGHLNGRGCKTLAEPNGNKTYIEAAFNFTDIQTMTSQGNYSSDLYPFQVTDDLEKQVFTRSFNDSPDYFKTQIQNNNRYLPELRQAICIGVHGTDNDWWDFLSWINDNYGKDGDDSVWFTSQEEYYEYNYYRIHGGSPKIELVNDSTLKVSVSLPSKTYFYYPSTTVNINGIKTVNIKSIDTNYAITGFSYADFKDGITVKIGRASCRERAASPV